MNNPHRYVVVLLLALGTSHGWFAYAADSSDGDDGSVKKTYYWQGTNLNNLSRLGGSGDFEQETRVQKNGKEADEYLAGIRSKMSTQAQKLAQEKNTLTYQGQLAGGPIEIVALSPGVRVILHAQAIFDENTAMLKTGGMDTIDRLRTVLASQGQKAVQFVIADSMDDVFNAKDVDAERSLIVISLLEMPQSPSE